MPDQVDLSALVPLSKGDYVTINPDGTVHAMEDECGRWLSRAWFATLACACPKGACSCDRSVSESKCRHAHGIACEDAQAGQKVRVRCP